MKLANSSNAHMRFDVLEAIDRIARAAWSTLAWPCSVGPSAPEITG
jgi:hypothetical protein